VGAGVPVLLLWNLSCAVDFIANCKPVDRTD
jgi:hypothetical protein